MASEVSCCAGLGLIWVTGNYMSQSKTSVPLCQTLHWMFHKVQCWAQFFFFCISMTCMDPQIRRVSFTLLTIQPFLHQAVTLTMFMLLRIGNWYLLITGSKPTDFLSTSVKLHIWWSPTTKMQLTLEFEIKFLQKFQQSNSLALHSTKTLQWSCKTPQY